MNPDDSDEPIDTAQARPSLPPRPSAAPTHQRRMQARHLIAERPCQDPTVDDRAKPPYLLRALRFAVQHGATDLHFHCGLPLMARAAGRLMPFQGHKPLSRSAAEKAIAQILTDEQWERLSKDGEVDFPLELPKIGRFRANAYRQHRGPDIVFRILPPDPPTLEQLGLPA